MLWKHFKTFLFPISTLCHPLATYYPSASDSVFDFGTL